MDPSEIKYDPKSGEYYRMIIEDEPYFIGEPRWGDQARRPTEHQHPNYGMTKTARIKILIEDDGQGHEGRAFTVEVSHEILYQLWKSSREQHHSSEIPYFDPFEWDRRYGSGSRATKAAQDEYLKARAREALHREQEERRAAEERAEKLRRAREAAARAEEARQKMYDDWRRINDAFSQANGAFGNFNFTTNARQGGKTKDTYRLMVIKMITTDVNEQLELTKLPDGRLYMRAKRACHPDTGGSHDKWLKLQDLAEKLGW